MENFSANFPPHYHIILAINCVHASNWFTHLQRPRQIDGQKDNSVLTEMHACSVIESIPKQHGFGRYSTKTPWYTNTIYARVDVATLCMRTYYVVVL